MNSTLVGKYQKAIKDHLTPRQVETLKTLYFFPNSTATAKQLADALNYSGFQAANRQIGSIGKALSEYGDIEPKFYQGKNGIQRAYFEIVGPHRKGLGWQMKPELKKALENLALVSEEDETEPESQQSVNDPLDETNPHQEGHVLHVLVNRYERNKKAREECIKTWGATCTACGFDFGKAYGSAAEGYIHVHHKIPLGEIKGEYKVDPINDLIPLCANCHSVIHLTKPAMSLRQLKKLLKKFSFT